MGPTWDLVAPGGPQVGTMNLAIRVPKQIKHGSPMTQSDIWGILHTAQKWQRQDLGHTLDSRQKQHISSHRWDSGCLLWLFAGKLTMIQWHYTVIQSGAIMTRSNITRYFKQHCMDRHIMWIRKLNHKWHPVFCWAMWCILWKFGWKLTAW